MKIQKKENKIEKDPILPWFAGSPLRHQRASFFLPPAPMNTHPMTPEKLEKDKYEMLSTYQSEFERKNVGIVTVSEEIKVQKRKNYKEKRFFFFVCVCVCVFVYVFILLIYKKLTVNLVFFHFKRKY